MDGPRVIGMTAPEDVVEGGALFIEDGVITARDAAARTRFSSLAAAGTAVERVAAAGLWALPGFVQTHVHLCQTLLRNGPDDLELLPWLEQHVWPGEAAHDTITLEISARMGLAELLAGGTTSILDMGTVRHTDAVFRAALASGMRVTSGNALMDDPATNPPYLHAETAEGLAETERLRLAWHGHEGRLRVAFCPRFAVSCTRRALEEAGEAARRHGLLVHTHASENRGEIALVRERTGLANIHYLESVGLAGKNVVLAHVVHTEESERESLAAKGTHVAHCPSSNLKLASGICPVPDYLRRGISVSLGADGAPCNDRLDAFSELRLAALLPKMSFGPRGIPAWDALSLATVNGAKALGLDGVGTLATGMRADFTLLDPEAGFTRPHAHRGDPYGPIVYAFSRENVVATYVDGIERFHRDRLDAFPLRPSAAEIEDAALTLRNRTRALLRRNP